MSFFDDSTRAKYVKRERVMIAVFGGLSMGLSSCCGGLVLTGVFEGDRHERTNVYSITNHHHYDGDRVELSVELDANRAVPVQEGGVEPKGWLVPSPESARFAVFVSSNSDLGERVADAGTFPAELRGRLSYLDQTGCCSNQVPSRATLDFATYQLGLPDAQDVWLLEAEDTSADTNHAVVFGLAGWLVLQLVVFVGAFLFARSHPLASTSFEDESVEERHPGLVCLFAALTCGFYLVYWDWVTTSELRQKTGRADLRPGMDLLLQVATFGLWRWYAYFRNAEVCDVILTRDGARNSNNRWAIFGVALASVFVSGLAVFATFIVLQLAYNKIRALNPIHRVAQVFE